MRAQPAAVRSAAAALTATLLKPLGGLGTAIAALAASPIVTVGHSAIFTLSDIAGQAIAPPPGGGFDSKRLLVSGLVGLLYFGPALHYWLQMISTYILAGVKDTLLKTLLGQSLGPAITAIFGASLALPTDWCPPPPRRTACCRPADRRPRRARWAASSGGRPRCGRTCCRCGAPGCATGRSST